MMRIEQATVDDMVARHTSWQSSLGKQGEQFILPDADLTGVDLAGRYLAEIHAPGAVLDRARLAGANLYGANLVGASLVEADLEGANLAKAELDQVRAIRARFTAANLTRCSLVGADLRESVLDRAKLIKTFLRRADLRGCTMRGTELDRVSLVEVTLGSMNATGATGSIVAGTAKLEVNGTLSEVDDDEIVAWLRAAGADVTIFRLPKKSSPASGA
jgi:uncharacterized protein YjbI with pentapeptide repeats